MCVRDFLLYCWSPKMCIRKVHPMKSHAMMNLHNSINSKDMPDPGFEVNFLQLIQYHQNMKIDFCVWHLISGVLFYHTHLVSISCQLRKPASLIIFVFPMVTLYQISYNFRHSQDHNFRFMRGSFNTAHEYFCVG